MNTNPSIPSRRGVGGTGGSSASGTATKPSVALLTFTTLALLSPTTLAQPTVEFRIIERAGRTQLSSADTILDLAVQARVSGGGSGGSGQTLGDFSFDIRIPNELESSGTLARARISNPDGTYFSLAPAITSSVGLGGIARTYSYVAGINPNFNGLINSSAGTFTHSPGHQEIGLIVGSATGNSLLGTPGIDELNGDTAPDAAPGADGLPDSWNAAHPWNSALNPTPPAPISGDTALIAPLSAGPYFARDQFIDLYRFRYTITNFSPRTLHFELSAVTASICDQLAFGYSWTTHNSPPPAAPSLQPLDIPITGACCNTADGSCSISSTCTTGPLFPGACAPNPCPAGTCCTAQGACTLESRGGCSSIWSLARTCTPNPCPQPGSCCTSTAACSITFAPACPDIWTLGGTCTPNTCPNPGRCCTTAGPCTTTLPVACTGTWSPDLGCSPNPCPGACCVNASCSLNDEFTCIVTLRGRFQSPGSACGLPSNPTTCCPANFNNADGVTTQDIWDFLQSWFAADPRADFDRNGQLQIFDIVTFVHAWFAGC